jgi:hypothetical protein
MQEAWRPSLAVLAATGLIGMARLAGWSEAPDPNLAELFRNSSIVALFAVGPVVYGHYLWTARRQKAVASR